MKHYLRIYRCLLSINFARLVIYRANFVSEVTISLIWGLFIIAQMLLLTSRSTSVYGWSREELLLLTGVFSIVVGIFHIFFTRNFERISEIINLGQLDTLLLKPVDSQFLTSLTYVNLGAITRLIAATAFTLFIIAKNEFQVSLLTLTKFSLAFAAGIVIIYSVWLIAVTLIMWAPRLSNIVEFMFSYMGMSRYPREMFQSVSAVVFFAFLPITFVAISPVKILIRKAGFVDVIGLFVLALVLLTLSRKFWKFALRYYTSASG